MKILQYKGLFHKAVAFYKLAIEIVGKWNVGDDTGGSITSKSMII